MGAGGREAALRACWLRAGCPGRMTITVPSTGEVIHLVDGSPETPGGPVLAAREPSKPRRRGLPRKKYKLVCTVCSREFLSRREGAEYCSTRCRDQKLEAALRIANERMSAG